MPLPAAARAKTLLCRLRRQPQSASGVSTTSYGNTAFWGEKRPPAGVPGAWGSFGATLPLTLCLPLGNLLICAACFSSYLFRRGQCQRPPRPEGSHPNSLTGGKPRENRQAPREPSAPSPPELPPSPASESEGVLFVHRLRPRPRLRGHYEGEGLSRAAVGRSRGFSARATIPRPPAHYRTLLSV